MMVPRCFCPQPETQTEVFIQITGLPSICIQSGAWLSSLHQPLINPLQLSVKETRERSDGRRRNAARGRGAVAGGWEAGKMGVFGAALVPAGAGEQLKRSERRVDSSHAGGGN